MESNFVYGWYCYKDGTNREFRYPANKERDLREGGKKVTVEVLMSGNWEKRSGVVVESNGNYHVTPA